MIYTDIFKLFGNGNSELVKDQFYKIMSLWRDWYRGNVPDFHKYTIKTVAGKTKECDKKSLQMAKQVCEDMVSMLWNDKTGIVVPESFSSRLAEILKLNNFKKAFPDFLEKALALGNGVIVEYLEDGEPSIDFINGDLQVPLEWNNGRITKIAILSQMVEDKTYFNHLTVHNTGRDDNGRIFYEVEHRLYQSDDKDELGDLIDLALKFPDLAENTKAKKLWADANKKVAIYKLRFMDTTPLFQMVRPAIANNYLLNCPLGISIYANCLDILKAVDNKYDNFDMEYTLGKRRVMVTSEALKKEMQQDAEGNVSYTSYFDTEETAFMALPIDGNALQSPVLPVDFTIRHESFIAGINEDLGILSYKVGLGEGFYSFDESRGLKTAREVVSEQSKLFRSKHKHQELLNDVLVNMVMGLYYIESVLNKNKKIGTVKSEDIKIVFDDSIIEDRDTERTLAISEVNNGLRSKMSYLKEFRDLNEAESEAELELIKKDIPEAGTLPPLG